MQTDPRIEPFFHEGTGTWTYVVSRGTDAVIIDPVLDYDPKSGRITTASAGQVLDYAQANGLHVHRIMETHAHADHLSAAAYLHARTGAAIVIGTGIRAVQARFAGLFRLAPDDPELTGAFDALLRDGDVVEAGSLRFEVMASPGHTPDSLSYRINGHVFVGDTLFAPDVGTARCDFPGGSAEDLYTAIQRLYALPDETTLWLCHDYPTAGRDPRASISVGESKRDNRMLRGDTTLQTFLDARQARDTALPAPNLLYPSLQVNLRGGRLPPAQDNGQRYLCTPLRVETPADGL